MLVVDLKLARTYRRLTQLELHKITGIHQSKISHFERGHVKPSSEEKQKLAVALKFNVNEIVWPEEVQGLMQGQEKNQCAVG